ncbi:ankyrin [Pseudovirgaria hyperparasitica]|uniref:Ankyrin n=1 Tax=Pseudovirgaria hyperparasitica TaxID=470096 RepID=A0A6A6VYP7_9PEZI|nr:ankyrin [Pseudovirgaria hyperparasitica]KAF2754864.1 ankyrin [Pseudovirgaria hyperparasitica]
MSNERTDIPLCEEPWLQKAARLWNIEHIEEIVKCLLRHGGDLNKDTDGGFSVVEEVMSVSTPLFESILAQCANINVERHYLETRCADGKTLLLCGLNNKELIRVLDEYGARSNVVDYTGNNALHILSTAFHRGNLFDEFLSRGLDPLSVNRHDNTLLHHLSSQYNGNDEFYRRSQRMIGFGISVNAQSNDRMTPLHVFLQRSDEYHNNFTKHQITFLETSGVSEMVQLGSQDVFGFAPLHLAALKSDRFTAEILSAGANAMLVTKDKHNALHLACRARYSNIVRLLLSKTGSCLLNQKDSAGRTPLHNACSASDLESVAALLRYGAEVSLVDARARTAIHARAETTREHVIWSNFNDDPQLMGEYPMMQFGPDLIARSSDVNPWYKSQHGCERKSKKPHNVKSFAKPLLEADVDVSTTTVLDIMRLCDLLIFKGADLLEPDPYGRTALHYIADTCLSTSRIRYQATSEPIRSSLLLWNQYLLPGRSIDVRDNEGNTPLLAYVASRANDTGKNVTACEKEFGAYKREYGDKPCHVNAFAQLFTTDSEADVQAVNNAGETASHIATRRRHGLSLDACS